MNDKQKENLILALNSYKNVCISIGLFTEFLTLDADDFLNAAIDPISEKDTLMTGLYAIFNNKNCSISNIYVSRLAYNTNVNEPAIDKDYHIRVSNNDIVTADFKNINAEGWSQLIKLEDFDRINNLRSFW